MKRIRSCGICGEKLIEQIIDKVERYRKDVGIVVFEDVPVLQCVKCGEQWFTSQVLEAMESILETKAKAPKKVMISVPAYPQDFYLQKIARPSCSCSQ